MSLNYKAEIIGTMTLTQKQHDGVTRSFKLQFRDCNALACVIHVRPAEKKEGEPQKYYHNLIWFAADIPHLKRMCKDGIETYFSGKLTNIKLNLYYPNNEVIMKHFIKAGLKVEAYYKEPKQTKANTKKSLNNK